MSDKPSEATTGEPSARPGLSPLPACASHHREEVCSKCCCQACWTMPCACEERAGLPPDLVSSVLKENSGDWSRMDVARFAHEHAARAVSAERERCALVCEHGRDAAGSPRMLKMAGEHVSHLDAMAFALNEAAARIRAGKEG